MDAENRTTRFLEAAGTIYPPAILHVEDLARIFKLSTDAARRHLRAGHFGARTKVGRRWCILRDVLEAHLAEQSELPEPIRRRGPVPRPSAETLRLLQPRPRRGKK